ncbi:MAG: alpha/beta hydrolase [Micropepsaceae bacterium]
MIYRHHARRRHHRSMESAPVAPKECKTMKTVTFRNRNWNVAADLHFPNGFDASKKYPAIICAHPISSCKEQTSGIYGRKLAELGYATLVFDASTQGASEGGPRFSEDPATRVEDFRCAVDYLMTQDFVDEDRVGVLGICGGGGYAVNATMTDHRIKALGTVVVANYGRLVREGAEPDAALKAIEALGKQRTAEARGAEPLMTTYIPNSPQERDAAGITDIDVTEAVDYYRTQRGQQPGSPNKLRFTSISGAFAFDAFHLAEQLLTQPLQVVIGSIPGGFGSYRDGYELFNKARSETKRLHVVEGASHYDLYDNPKCIDEAVGVLGEFYGKNL